MFFSGAGSPWLNLVEVVEALTDRIAHAFRRLERHGDYRDLGDQSQDCHHDTQQARQHARLVVVGLHLFERERIDRILA